MYIAKRFHSNTTHPSVMNTNSTILTSARATLLAMLLLSTFQAANAQGGDNVILNGDFSNNLNSWSSFVADWERVGASFAVVDGQAAITNIVNAGAVVWHVQFNQLLTSAQIASLEVGSNYTLTFNARSSVAGRPIRVFFGQNGGAFTSLTATDFNLTTSMAGYSVTFRVSATFPEMKLGFEMGLSTADVFIDNVVLVKGGTASGLSLPVDFEGEAASYALVDFGGTSSQIVTDPTNSANNVVRTIKTGAAETWAGTTVGGTAGFNSPIPFTAQNTTMSVRVWSPHAGIQVRLKVENSSNPTMTVETEATVTVAEGWETLVFNFANQAPGTATLNLNSTYNKASIFFNFNVAGGVAGERTYYWDNMSFGGIAAVTAPATPVGFVVSNMIGARPVAPGEIFLAAGPNNVENPSIVYRLFYSLTSAAPSDPKTATEYTFGTTAGDGGGDTAFGFVVANLQPGASYTFWLYQYNVSTGMFSQPAVGTAISGVTTSIDDLDGTPTHVILAQNYPNPFNPTTSIRFALSQTEQVRLEVFNTMGQRVAVLVDGSLSAGVHAASFDASGLSSGVYVYRLHAGSTSVTRTMILLK